MSENDRASPSFTRQDFENVIATVLTRRSRPDLLEPLFAPEAEWELNGDPAAWAYAGRRKSRDAILGYLKAFATEFALLALERFETLIEGEQAAVRYAMNLRHRGTGKQAQLDCLCFIRVEGGLIVEGVELLDSAQLFRMRV